MKRTLLFAAAVTALLAVLMPAPGSAGVASVNANHKIAVHVIPHGTTCKTLPSFASCSDIHSTYAGTGDIDVIPVFYDLTAYTVLEFGITWPAEWGDMDFTRCAGHPDLVIGGIVNPGDGIAIAWTECQHAWSAAAGYGWLEATGPGRIALVPNVTGDYGVAACSEDDCAYDHPRGICNAGVGGTSGDDPCLTTDLYYPLNLSVGDGLTGGCTYRGDSLTYTLSFDNRNNGGAVHNVGLADSLPQGTEFVSASSGGAYDAISRTVTWDIGTLAQNGTGSRTVTVLVTVEPPATVANACRIAGDEVPATVTVRTTNVCVPSGCSALTLSKTAPAGSCVDFEANLTYTLWYSNSPNTVTVHDVVLVDSLPAQTEFVSATGGGIYDAGALTVTWSLGTLMAHAGGSKQVTVKVNAPLNSSFTNVCHLTSTEAPPSTASKTLTVCSTLYHPLKLTKTAPTYECVAPGADLTYTLSASNTTNIRPVHGVVLTDYLPGLTDFISATGGGVYDSGARTVIWNFDSLAAGAADSRQVTIRVNVPLNSYFTNSCAVTCAEAPQATASRTLRVCFPPGNNPLNKIAIHVKAHPTSCTTGYPTFTYCEAINHTYPGGGEIDVVPVFFDLMGYTMAECGMTWPEASWGSGSWTKCKGDLAIGNITHSADQVGPDPTTKGVAIAWSTCQNRWSAAPGYVQLAATTPGRICPAPSGNGGAWGVVDCQADPVYDAVTAAFCAGVMGVAGDMPCSGPQGTQPTTWGSIKAMFK